MRAPPPSPHAASLALAGTTAAIATCLADRQSKAWAWGHTRQRPIIVWPRWIELRATTNPRSVGGIELGLSPLWVSALGAILVSVLALVVFLAWTHGPIKGVTEAAPRRRWVCAILLGVCVGAAWGNALDRVRPIATEHARWPTLTLMDLAANATALRDALGRGERAPEVTHPGVIDFIHIRGGWPRSNLADLMLWSGLAGLAACWFVRPRAMR